MPINNFPLRLAEGITAKLDFDYACNRGHSFGEYHVHGVVNEILCANIDPATRNVRTGFAHPAIQTEGNGGRKREIDFLLEGREPVDNEICIEVKWAGSSHCKPENVLLDLCRLQIIKAARPETECVFILSGPEMAHTDLFNARIFLAGTNCLLHRRSEALTQGTGPRVKSFLLASNPDHSDEIEVIMPKLVKRLPTIPRSVHTTLIHSTRSAPQCGRFQTLVWTIGAGAGES
ncbi:hypothetical protein [Sphingobium sp. R-7]|uniref:hypothetical protein n=1 Tax=Sphingobium sp. R-7 TaxID=3375449 RepID=UPI00398B99B0